MGEYEFTVYGIEGDNSQVTVYAVDIQEIGGKFHQRLDGFTTVQDRFMLEDFNRDGYIDVRIHKYPGGSMRNEPSMFWLWDTKQNKYVKNQQLEELSEENGIRMADDGRLVTHFRVGVWWYGVSHYSYRNNTFVEMERIEVRPQDENDVTNSGKLQDTYKRINGEMKLVSTEILEEIR
jgi:hypothetical protein